MDRVPSSCSQVSDIQSPIEDDELQGLASTDEAVPTPEPETEIEIAAEADTVQDGCHHHDIDANGGDNGSETGSDPSAETELLNTAAARLRLSSRPGSSLSALGSRLGSGVTSHCSTPSSTPVMRETLEYRSNTKQGARLSIVCHYNPIMDEYITLTDEADSNNCSSKEDDDIELLFDLCKDDFPISSKEQTVDVKKFLKELSQTGLQRDDPRLQNLIKELSEIAQQEDNSTSLDALKLNLSAFKRVVKQDFQIISKAFKNQFVIPKFGDFCCLINGIYDECVDIRAGSVASYIPQLACYSPDSWGVSIVTVDGQRYNKGDTKTPFTMQSCSKPFTYAVCLNELGSETVHQFVGQEPSGRMFNNLCLDYSNKPHNPLLNSGAIMSAGLLLAKLNPGLPVSSKFDLVMNYFNKMSGGDNNIGFNNSVFLSERDTADRNFALAYFMKENKCFPPGFNLQETLDFYFQTCSMEITCESLAMLGACLANGGVCPTSGVRVLASHVVRDVLSLMHSCGMYNYSGQFAFKVGLPAKSGVSGALVLVVPGVMGVGLWSPPLDSLGNTVRGVAFAEKFVNTFNFHRFDNLLHLRSKIDPRKHRYDTCQQTTTSLMYSATTGDVTALRRLHGGGSDMGARDYDGRTALHLAAAEGHTHCVDFLLDTCGLSPLTKDRWGFTPLVEAHRFRHTELVAHLMQIIRERQPESIEACTRLLERMTEKEKIRKASLIEREISTE